MTRGRHTRLHEGFELAAERFPDGVAVESSEGRAITYRELDRLSAALAAHLRAAGVAPGDRVGFCLWKSIDAIATLLGILRAGAVYVPLDPAAPARRNAVILDDCKVALAVVGASFEEALAAELAALGFETPLLVVDQQGDRPLASALAGEGGAGGAPAPAADSAPADPAPADPAAADAAPADSAAADPMKADPAPGADELAYILYTSGSTGRPKGVMVSHRNALGFVDWCDDLFAPRPDDHFSSHAPLHFDLSILDVHLALRSGATLVLVDEDLGKDPARLAEFMAARRLTVWYSAPSILALMARKGHLAGRDLTALRLVLFAGEVFPIAHLREMMRQMTGPAGERPRFFNLYGPTETNVCTYHEVEGTIPDEQTEDLPIGRVCPHYTAKVVDPDGREVPPGEVGELLMAGESVMRGYWNLPDETARCFADDGERRWYRTGDLVIDSGGERGFLFRGRKDRMVKKRGYRVELGEIETCLNAHDGVSEVGVVARPDEDRGMLVTAFVGAQAEQRPSVIALKAYCAESLPLYMVPDVFVFVDALPRTSTGKVDYQRLKERL